MIPMFAFGIVACSEDIIEREASPVAATDISQVYFPYLLSDIDIANSISLSEFSFEIMRKDGTAAEEVNITLSDSSGFFTLASTVNFSAGETEQSVIISYAGNELFTTYTMDIEIDTEINPYLVDTFNQSSLRINFIQSDYQVYATGNYTSSWYGATYAQDLEYSKILNLYRFPDVMAAGYGLEFKWDGADSTIMAEAIAATGNIHPDYGMVSAKEISSTYDEASKTFTFEREWLVSVGSFGVDFDIYVMD